MGQHRAGADRPGARTWHSTGIGATLPAPLAELVEDFADVGPKQRLELLLAGSAELHRAPGPYAVAADTMEQVHDAQSLLFLAVEVEDADDHTVHLYFSAPPDGRRPGVSPRS